MDPVMREIIHALMCLLAQVSRSDLEDLAKTAGVPVAATTGNYAPFPDFVLRAMVLTAGIDRQLEAHEQGKLHG